MGKQVLWLFLVSCFTVVNAQEGNAPEITFEKPFTTDTVHYTYALNYWTQGRADHFPPVLPIADSMNFFFAPRILQGRASMELKVYYESTQQAKNAFEVVSCPDSCVFNSYREVLSSHLALPFHGVHSEQSSSGNIKIKLLHSFLDDGKTPTGGDFIYGLVYSEKERSVRWWTVDHRL